MDRSTDGTTPRPWKVIVESERGDYGSILSRYLDRIEGANGRTAVKFFDDYGTDQSADAALIVAAVNDYDRLRLIEDEVRHLITATDERSWVKREAHMRHLRALARTAEEE